MQTFLANYRLDVEPATVNMMPHTTLTKNEYNRIIALLGYAFGPDLWARFERDGVVSLSVAERTLLTNALAEWMGTY